MNNGPCSVVDISGWSAIRFSEPHGSSRAEREDGKELVKSNLAREALTPLCGDPNYVIRAFPSGLGR